MMKTLAQGSGKLTEKQHKILTWPEGYKQEAYNFYMNLGATLEAHCALNDSICNLLNGEDGNRHIIAEGIMRMLPCQGNA